MSDHYIPSDPQWFALYVRVRHERAVEKQLAEKGLEAFLPCYESRRKWVDRFKTIEFPLFPGYLFCRFTQQQRWLVQSAFGVVRVVGFGNRLIPVDENEILALQKAVQAGVPCEPTPYLAVGQRVRVGFGPLNGVEGILLDTKKGNRLVLSVTLLERSVSVEVDESAVEAVLPAKGEAARVHDSLLRRPA
jgi:transcription antitermination factor NusG